jgi:TRAP-type C4-dicarboxylate transport system substrate-binding protein
MGTADLAWLMASFYPSQLPISQTFNLVMLGVEDSEVAVETMWDLYEWSDALQKEYSKTKLLQIYSIQNFISTNGIAFTSLNDIKGMNIRSLAGTATDITTLLNANPISMGPGELYDAVSKHVIDGYILGWQGIRTFNLDEVTDYYCTMDLISILEGVIINTDVFNSLPEEYQEVLTYYSGREMSLEQARRMAEEDEDFYSSLDQNKIVKLDAETYDEFSNMAEKYNYNRVEGIDAEGFDGNAFLDKLYERAGYYQGIYSK